VFHSVNGAIRANVDAEEVSAETVNGSIHLQNIGDRAVVAINTKTLNGATYVSAVSLDRILSSLSLYFSH
jgi:DUF4097 and DUF4098 domain-containing protein YvlB